MMCKLLNEWFKFLQLILEKLNPLLFMGLAKCMGKKFRIHESK